MMNYNRSSRASLAKFVCRSEDYARLRLKQCGLNVVVALMKQNCSVICVNNELFKTRKLSI